jgi:hypothetical protein
MVMPIDGQSRRDGNLFAEFFSAAPLTIAACPRRRNDFTTFREPNDGYRRYPAEDRHDRVSTRATRRTDEPHPSCLKQLWRREDDHEGEPAR